MSYYSNPNYPVNDFNANLPQQMQLQPQQQQQQTSFASLLTNASAQQNLAQPQPSLNSLNTNLSALTNGPQSGPSSSSPLSYNSLLNAQRGPMNQSPGSLYHNLANNGNAGNIFSSSLPSSTASSASSTYQSLVNSSPQSSIASLYTLQRARFMSSKGFELEDDIEFCPEISNGSNSHIFSLLSNNNSTSHKFNPYTSSVFSPQTSPHAEANSQISPLSPETLNAPTLYSKVAGGGNNPANPVSPINRVGSPRSNTPRVKKVLEIVNPHTGMRIGSPQPVQAQIAK